MIERCERCGEPRGVNPVCPDCRETAQRVSRDEAEETTAKAEGFMDSPPWYTRMVHQSFWRQLRLMNSMIRAYLKGEYREVPWSVIASVVVAIAYVICPADLIPDVLFPFGFLDDAAVVSLVFRSFEHELDEYAQNAAMEAA